MFRPLLIRNAQYQQEFTDLLVTRDGVAPAGEYSHGNVEELDAHGLVALPGLVDVHVHFRDPGLTEKEDLLSGSRAAAAGGYTTVLCEPNTRPVIDIAEAVEEFSNRVQALAIPLQVLTKGAVTLGEQGETLTDIAALRDAQAAALSDDGEPLVSEEILIAAFRASEMSGSDPLVLTAHCEETPRSAEKVRAALGNGPAMRREVELIRLHLAALAKAGVGRLHIQHVSLAESVSLIADARQQGLAVTAEVTPHHLLLCEEDIPHADANWKMNPPLRSHTDMMAMRRALADGAIEMIATDHAPHTPAEKSQGWESAPFGIVGLETAFASVLSLVHNGTISMERVVDAMCVQPARLLPSWAQAIRGGDLILVDPHAAWTVEPENFYTKGRNCPFIGRSFTGKVLYTIARGRLVMANGKVMF